MLDKLKNIDRRWIFLIILIAVIVPLVRPMGLTTKTSKPVEDIYNYIESLPPGSVILMSFDYSPSTKIELGPAAEAVMNHAFSKDLKVVTMALWPDGAQLSRTLLKKSADKYHKEYGKDYVNLGYKAGGAVVLMGLKDGFSRTFPTDVDKTDINDLPLMNKVKNFNNIALDISFSAGGAGMKEHVLVVNTQFGVKVAAACTAVSAPEMYAYLNSGQLLGLMGGLKGAAEYETLMNYTGEARQGMDAQSVVHMVIILFILFSNITYFIDEHRKRQGI